MITLSDDQLTALRNLGRKNAGEAVDFINIAQARTLTEMGLAHRESSGWRISESGLALLKHTGASAAKQFATEASSLRKFKDEGK